MHPTSEYKTTSWIQQNNSVCENDKVIDLKWKIDYKTSKTEGQYLLRTNYGEYDEKLQWKIYNTFREIESTFRVLKTDLDLRPIYYKTQQAVMAHLHLGLLAYWFVNTITHSTKTTIFISITNFTAIFFDQYSNN